VLPDKATAARNKRLYHHSWPHSGPGILAANCRLKIPLMLAQDDVSAVSAQR
jgi:hypothetical protein